MDSSAGASYFAGQFDPDPTSGLEYLRVVFSAVPVIAVSMGDKGIPSRLLASKFGAHLTFGCLSNGRGTAPGQFSMKELLQFRIHEQSESTQVCLFRELKAKGQN